jgi:hypothetical protein
MARGKAADWQNRIIIRGSLGSPVIKQCGDHAGRGLRLLGIARHTAFGIACVGLDLMRLASRVKIHRRLTMQNGCQARDSHEFRTHSCHEYLDESRHTVGRYSSSSLGALACISSYVSDIGREELARDWCLARRSIFSANSDGAICIKRSTRLEAPSLT